jgi:hypothetical protein
MDMADKAALRESNLFAPLMVVLPAHCVPLSFLSDHLWQSIVA